MTCDETKLSEYFDNELPPEERRQVERHIDGCPSCRMTLGSFARVRASLGAYRAPDIFAETLQAKLAECRKSAAKRRALLRFSWTAAAVLAATVLFALATISLFVTEQVSPTDEVALRPSPHSVFPTPATDPKPPNVPELSGTVERAAEEPTPFEEHSSVVSEQHATKEKLQEQEEGTSLTQRTQVAVSPTQMRPTGGLREPEQNRADKSREERNYLDPPVRLMPPPTPTTSIEQAQPQPEMPEPIEVDESVSPARVQVATLQAAERGVSAFGKDLAPLPIELPQPYFGGTPLDYFSPNLEEKSYKPRDIFLAPKGATNLARGKPVTSSDPNPRLGKLTFVTDGEKGYQDDYLLELASGVQYVQIDLGQTSEVYAVLFWHFHAADRIYFDIVIQISDDPEFTNGVTTVYNNDIDNTSGLGVGKDKEYIETYEGRLIDAKGVKGRYVRLYSSGNTTDHANHYTEVEVFGLPSGK